METQERRRITLSLAACKPTSGSSFIPTSKYMTTKFRLSMCKTMSTSGFLCSILWPTPVKVHLVRVDEYKKCDHELNGDGLCFLLDIRQVEKFENLNPTLSVNVLA
jgi:hypothetical protein